MDRLRAAVRRRRPARTTARASGIRASSCRAGRSTCFWRKDGEPIWNDPTLFADEHDDARRDRAQTRERFLAARGDAPRRRPRSTSSPAYEDAWYYLWRERKLPINVDPFDRALADTLERDAPAPRVRAAASSTPSATCCRSRATSDGRAAGARPALVPARRPLLPDPGRFADRLPPAARFAAVGRAGDMPWLHRPTRRDLAAAAAARAVCDPRCDGEPRAARVGASRRGAHVRHERDAERRARHRRERRRAPARAATPARRAPASSRPASSSAPRSAPSRATAGSTSSCRRRRRSRTTSSSSPRSRTPRAAMQLPVILEGYEPPQRPAPASCCASRPTRA